MILSPAICKLLGMPESVTEPTAYHLLGLDPRAVTASLVDQSLRERKIRLRSGIPGPQFIPIISRIERELDEAAATLRDPDRRRAYNERLLEQSRRGGAKAAGEKRRRLVRACGKAVRAMVDAEGCLAEPRRPELARRLEHLGLPADQIRYVLDRIPEPARPSGAAPPEDNLRAREQAMQFFMAAVDLELEQGPLSQGDERKLLAMADRFGVPAHIARRKISTRLKDLDARRAERDESGGKARFKLHVLAMYPMGDAGEIDRKRLVALAAAEGLSIREAEEVLREYLPGRPGSTQDIGERLAEDPLPVLEALAAEARSQPAAPGPGPVRLARIATLVLVPLMVLVAGVAVYAIAHSLSQVLARRSPAPATTQLAGAPGGSTPRRADSPPPPLLREAMAALHSRAKVRQLFQDANDPARAASLRAAADLLVLGGTPREQVLAEGLFRSLLHCPPAAGEVQEAAATALIDRMEAAADAGALRRPEAYRAAGLLASTLFLSPTPGFTVTDAQEMKRMLAACRRAWDESLRSQPWDPANDPKRLAYAVLEGGSLTMYGDRADPNRYAAVCAELVSLAGDPARPGSQEASEALMTSAGHGAYPPDISRVARLSLCRVIEVTADVRLAERARTKVASVMSLDLADPLRAAPLGTAAQRESVAAGLRRAVNLQAAPPPATEPATAPQTRPAPPPPVETPIADKLRGRWGAPGRTPEVLADLAAAMLACTDRLARFTARSDVLTRELSDALDQKDASLRAARLTRHVRMAELATPGLYPVAPTLDEDVAKQLDKDLRSADGGARDRAIEQLRILDGREAAAMLTRRVGELAQAGQSEYPVINRILRALLTMHDRKIPAELAELIEPARSNYAAHRIVMTLLEGSGRQDVAQQWRFRLPINHSSPQRSDCAARWKAVAASCAWGPGLVDAAVAGHTGPPPAWQPAAENEKLLALFAHYAKLASQLLRTHRPARGAEVPPLPDLRPSQAKVNAPVRGDEFLKALEGLVAELERLARSHPAARSYGVQIDMVLLTDRSRGLACQTTLQQAAVRLETAGRLLEILVQQADRPGGRKPALEQFRKAHQAACAKAENVLVEMRQNCLYCLMLLEILPMEGL